MQLKNYFMLGLVALALLLGCSKSGETERIIDRDTFIDVLVDIHMADAILAVKGYRINTDSTQIRLYYNDVLVKHQITQKQIENTFAYYTQKPIQFERIYEKVSEKIVQLEEEYKKKADAKE